MGMRRRRAIDYASIDPEADKFRTEVLMLVAAAALCAVFTGLRGEFSCLSTGGAEMTTCLFTCFSADMSCRLREHVVLSDV